MKFRAFWNSLSPDMILTLVLTLFGFVISLGLMVLWVADCYQYQDCPAGTEPEMMYGGSCVCVIPAKR